MGGKKILHKNLFFTLNPGCFLIKGALNSAIYDLISNKVYSLNSKGSAILEKSFQKVSGKLDKEANNFILKIQRLHLGSFIEKPRLNNDIKTLKPDLKLSYLWLELTSRCNLKCIHCYADSSLDNANSVSFELKKRDWKKVLMEGYELGCRSVQFIGGEPIMSRDLHDLIIFSHGIGFKKIDVFTNATMINKKFIKICKDCNIHVRISLYGGSPQVHDSITQIKGSFHKTSNSIKFLRKNNISVKIAVILMKQNQLDLENIIKHIHALGFEYSGYDTVRPTGRGDNQELFPTDNSILSKRLLIEPNFSIDQTTFAMNQNWNACWSGKLAITSYGEVLPCIFARDLSVGNIKNATLENLIKNDKLLTLWGLSKDSIDTCKDCEFRYACTDCRPLALSMSGSLYAKYPRCFYDPYTGRWNKLKEKKNEKA